MATSDAPIAISHVTLRVRDLARVADFYRNAIGLVDRPSEPGTRALGTSSRTLLVLREAPDAPPRGPREAGLFHTAFLVPTRGDLGAFLTHLRKSGLPLEGAADHAVSEALYLSDPEGNGIEVYVDRPREAWPYAGGMVAMVNARLDFDAITASASGPWHGAPEGTVVGHVHLCVGDLAPAESFWRDLGLEVTCRFDGASFLASGGYHHHIGVNVWRSKGAGPVPEAAGLAAVHLLVDPDAYGTLGGTGAVTTLHDPWRIPVEIAAKES